MKLIAIAAVAATGYVLVGETPSPLSKAYHALKDLTLISVAEREQRCPNVPSALECSSSFDRLLLTVYEAEKSVFEALNAEEAGDTARVDAVVARMQDAARDGRAELERLKALHVP